MNSIGGYFGLELNMGQHVYHESMYKLKSGRSSLGFVLNSLKPRLVYLPFYTCDALLEPFADNSIPFAFYSINRNFQIENMPELKEGELLLYINYYGIKDEYVEELSVKFSDKLIVDCTQAYFTRGNGRSWFFNSSRKFFGVPDGSDLYIPTGFGMDECYQALPVNEQYITDHLIARFNGNAAGGYPYFQENEILNGGAVSTMSTLTRHLLSNTDFESVSARRKENFNYLHGHLQATNQLQISTCTTETPFFYPYLPHSEIDKKKLWAVNIFVPVFWGDCLNRNDSANFSLERELCEKLLPLPVDHRYSFKDLERMLTFLN